jgi:predicted TIM-barrel fold metal-dependent hydrolase
MKLKTPDGAYMMPDDNLFDPIYSHLAKRGRPLVAHFADPIEAWLPLDPKSVNFSYYANNPEWHVHGREGFPSHAEILAAADNVLAKHPDLIMLAAHLGSMEHDLDALAQRLDRHPNLYVDVSARTPALTRQPAKQVRDFFIKYQDRVLYGVDVGEFTPGATPSKDERVKFTKAMERCYRTDFAYYAGKGSQEYGRREIEGLALPRSVLKKFYHGNARRLMPALAE